MVEGSRGIRAECRKAKRAVIREERWMRGVEALLYVRRQGSEFWSCDWRFAAKVGSSRTSHGYNLFSTAITFEWSLNKWMSSKDYL